MSMFHGSLRRVAVRLEPTHVLPNPAIGKTFIQSSRSQRFVPQPEKIVGRTVLGRRGLCRLRSPLQGHTPTPALQNRTRSARS